VFEKIVIETARFIRKANKALTNQSIIRAFMQTAGVTVNHRQAFTRCRRNCLLR